MATAGNHKTAILNVRVAPRVKTLVVAGAAASDMETSDWIRAVLEQAARSAIVGEQAHG